MAYIKFPQQKDAALQATKYLPAAAATNYSDSFDLVATGYAPENVGIIIDFPASANHVDSTKSVTITLQHSSDNSSFSNFTLPTVQLSVAGVVSTGSTAKQCLVRLPGGLSRYIRFAQVVPSGDGDLTGDQVTYSVVVW
jgi:hypothetical protein